MAGFFWILLLTFPQAVSIEPSAGTGPGFVYEILAGSGICPQNRQTGAAPEKFLERSNPLRDDPSAVEAGKRLYHKDAKPTPCRLCHGVRGNGNGRLAPNMDPPPRNFTCAETMQNLPEGQLFWIIKNGSRGTKMPRHKGDLTDRQIWQLIRYIRSFAR